jgi:hypothetical protein
MSVGLSQIDSSTLGASLPYLRRRSNLGNSRRGTPRYCCERPAFLAARACRAPPSRNWNRRLPESPCHEDDVDRRVPWADAPAALAAAERNRAGGVERAGVVIKLALRLSSDLRVDAEWMNHRAPELAHLPGPLDRPAADRTRRPARGLPLTADHPPGASIVGPFAHYLHDTARLGRARP